MEQCTCHQFLLVCHWAPAAEATPGLLFAPSIVVDITGMESGCGDLISYPATTWYRPPLIQLTVQSRSNRYGWSGFNRTTFQGNNHISANILEFGGVPCRPVGSHMAIVDRVE